MKYTPYSFSKLNTHKQCGRRFKYQYIDKIPQEDTDRTPLIKGGAIHSILEKYPEPSTHKMAEKYQDIADRFIVSTIGQKYMTNNSVREHSFGLTSSFKPTTYSDKEAIFRGHIDYICLEEMFVEEIIEVDDITEIPSGYEVVEVIENWRILYMKNFVH